PVISPTDSYPLSLHAALPICCLHADELGIDGGPTLARYGCGQRFSRTARGSRSRESDPVEAAVTLRERLSAPAAATTAGALSRSDREGTRLHSSHQIISYSGF